MIAILRLLSFICVLYFFAQYFYRVVGHSDRLNPFVHQPHTHASAHKSKHVWKHANRWMWPFFGALLTCIVAVLTLEILRSLGVVPGIGLCLGKYRTITSNNNRINNRSKGSKGRTTTQHTIQTWGWYAWLCFSAW